MPIAKLKREKRKDPLWGIILSIIVGSVLMIYPLSYDISGWRPLFHYDHVVLGCVPANMVWGVVRIWYGDFYRSIA